MTETTQQPRLLTNEELAVLIKYLRQSRGWSQEQLADISGLSTRTVQRAEQGTAPGLDTRRALAKAFDLDDIDTFSKPLIVPTDEDIKKAQEKFERENVMLKTSKLTTGQQLASLVETNSMDLSTPAFDMTREAEVVFAELIDYFRDYRDCAELYSEVQKIDVYDDLQKYINDLLNLGVSLCYSVRKLLIKFGNDPSIKPTASTALYVVAFPLGQEPEEFATPRSTGIKF